jgi:hypothetical protein
MRFKENRALAMFLFLSLIAMGSCQSKPRVRNRLDENSFPRTVLWAWERPEDLKALDAGRVAVAFLAQTLVLKGDDVVFTPRHQPLEVSPATRLMAVTRIESQKTTGQSVALSDSQKQKAATLILKTLELKNVSAIQVDFDAVNSERDFYRGLLQDLRRGLPDNIPLSMTALASFCIGDRWLSDLPVDEAVPMAFRMGADERTIKTLLAAGEDFREPLCRRSYGIAVDEPLDLKFRPDRRIYIFNDHSWKASDLAGANERIQR